MLLLVLIRYLLLPRTTFLLWYRHIQIRAAIANASQAASSIAKLPELRLGVGYKDPSTVSNNSTTRMSQNTQGFLLNSLFISNQTYGTTLEPANVLLSTFWAQIVNQPQYYSWASGLAPAQNMESRFSQIGFGAALV